MTSGTVGVGAGAALAFGEPEEMRTTESMAARVIDSHMRIGKRRTRTPIDQMASCVECRAKGWAQ